MDRQVEYTLPGIVHYLQQEQTRNERDRIHWSSEREEMRAAISRLTAENLDLKRTNQRLEKELMEARDTHRVKGANGSASSVVTEDLSEELANLDIAPLRNARELLKSRMGEIDYLLHGSSDKTLVSMLELKKQRGVLALTELRKKREQQRAIDAVYNKTKGYATPDSEAPPDLNHSSSPFSDECDDGVSPFSKKSPVPEVQVPPLMDLTDVETDNETVIGEEDGNDGSGYDVIPDPKLIPAPLFSLPTHPSDMVALSVLGDQLLAASQEGTIMLYQLSQLVGDPKNPKPKNLFFDNDQFLQVKWVDNDTFVTAGQTTLKRWKSSDSESGKLIKATFSDIQDLQAECGHIYIKDGSKLCYINKLVDHPGVKTLVEECGCFTVSNDKLLVYIPDAAAIDLLDPTTGQNIKSIAVPQTSNTPITKITNYGTKVALISSSQILIYDIDTNEEYTLTTSTSPYLDCILTAAHFITVTENGNVDVYSMKNTQHHLQFIFSHYLKRNTKTQDTLAQAVVGAIYQDKYFITGGSDMAARGWALV